MTPDEMTSKLNELEGVLTETTKRADRAEAITKLSAEDRTLFDGFSKEDQDKFLAADEVGKAAMRPVEKSDKEEDVEKEEKVPESIQKRFDEISKQLAAAETRASAAEAVAKAEKEKREITEFSKRAETDYPNLPGEAMAKGLILKCLNDKLTKEEFASVEGLLKAGNEALGQLTTPVGKDGGIVTKGAEASFDTIEKRAVAFAKDSAFKGTKEQAVTAFLSTKEGSDLYNAYLATKGSN